MDPVIALTAPINVPEFTAGERSFTITFSNPRLTSKEAEIDTRVRSGTATFIAIATDNPQVQMRDASVAVEVIYINCQDTSYYFYVVILRITTLYLS